MPYLQDPVPIQEEAGSRTMWPGTCPVTRCQPVQPSIQVCELYKYHVWHGQTATVRQC